MPVTCGLCRLNPGNIIATNLAKGATEQLGVIRSRPMWLVMFGESLKTLPQGAATTLFCATAPLKSLKNGGFYWFFAPTTSLAPRRADDPELSRRLWEVSEELLAPFF